MMDFALIDPSILFFLPSAHFSSVMRALYAKERRNSSMMPPLTFSGRICDLLKECQSGMHAKILCKRIVIYIKDI